MKSRDIIYRTQSLPLQAGGTSPPDLPPPPPPLGLVVSFIGAPTSGTVPLAVTFTPSISGGVAPLTYAWTFGDGGTSASSAPTHAYMAQGTFDVSLTVTDANGLTGSATRLGYIVGTSPVDLTPPVTSGSISITGLTSSGYTATCPVYTDTSGILKYQYRIGLGGAITDIAGGGRSVTRSGLSADETIYMRAVDNSPAQNVGAWVSYAVTLPSSVPTTATLSVASATATAGGSGVLVYVTLDHPAPVGGIPCTVTHSGSSSLPAITVAAGQTVGSALLTDAAAEVVTLNLTATTPALTLAGNPKTVTFSVAAAPGALPSFTLSPGVTTGTQPFAFGHAFRQGDVPAGQVANAASATDWQCTPMTYWPDGSLKHAIIAGRAAVTAGVDLALALTAGAAAGGAALTEADLTTALGGTAVVIGVDADSTTLGSLIGTAALHTTVCAGPVMSSWVYRRPVSGNNHLVVFVEVRLFKGGEVEIFPWVENGYLSVASPTNFVRTCTVTIGGVSRFSQSIDIKHHTRVPLITGSAFSYWVGSDPQIKPKHDRDYLISTKLIPNLAAAAPAGATLDALQQTYAPNTLAGDTTANGAAGGEGGVVSVPSAYYVTSSADTRAYSAMMVHALSSGSWSHHYRDEATNLPIAFSAQPLATLADTSTPTIPTPTGGENAAGPAMSHSVSYAYLPWLVTGRWWFLEELHFWATYGYLSTSAAYRGNGAGWHVHAQPRFRAWSLNVLAQSASVTPASHPLRAEFLASWEANTSRHYGRFVSGTVDSGTWVSPIGVLGTYSGAIGQPSPFPPPNPSTAWWDGAYQQNYLATVFGYTRDIGIPQSAQSQSDHVAVSTHAYKLVVGRADDGLNGRYNWRRFIAYGMPIGTDDAGIPLDSWYSTHDQVYAELVSGYGLSAIDPAYGGALKSHSTDTDMAGGTSLTYGSTALAVLALAVDHEAPGANLAWYRVSGASNFSLFDAYFSDEAPYWGIKPRKPNWSLPAAGEVTDLGTATLNAGVGRTVNWWTAWSGVAWAPWWGTAGSILAAGGGHTDGDQNDVARFDIATGAFSMLKSPPATAYAKAAGNLVADTATDGWMWANTTPGDTTMQTGESPAQHHYGGLLAIPSNAIESLGATNGILCHVGQAAIANNGDNGSKAIHVLRMGQDQQYTRYGPSSASLSHHRAQRGTCYDAKRNRVWFPQHNASDPSVTFAYRDMSDGSEGTQAFSLQGGMSAWASSYDSMEWSSRHDCIVRIMEVPGSSPREYTKIIVLDLATNLAYQPAQTGTPPAGDNNFAAGWSDTLNCFVVLRGSSGDNKVYFCKPSGNPRTGSWAWTSQTITSGTVRAAQGNPAFNRLRHVTALGNVLLWAADARYPVQLIGVTPP